MTSIADILTTSVLADLFRFAPCDICQRRGSVYPDPENGLRWCISCIEAECERLEKLNEEKLKEQRQAEAGPSEDAKDSSAEDNSYRSAWLHGYTQF